ncbi:MAG: glucosamine-6-phosphate deaminase [Oligosphaeraceae bacterium]|nr:glucosamine-6-phosphate deaminase [Oligosphaeraceae bacterium]
MRVIICPNEDAVAKEAYKLVRDRVVHAGAKVLGLPTGSTPIKLYGEIAKGYKRQEIDFSDVHSFNLDEYLGLPPEHKQSYRYFMNENLFKHINIKLDNTHFLDGLCDDIEGECMAFEALIEDLGGIKLQILGIGRDGHIGFNEPGTPLNSRTGYVTLAPETIEDNKRFFKTADEVPRWALSMGVGTILEAREILLLATGSSKADAIAGMIEGPICSMNTASALQMHNDVTVILDEAAAGKLERKEHYMKTGGSDNVAEMYAYLMAARKKAGLD